MKTLYLLRHADAVKFGASDDKAREVTQKGLVEIQVLSKLLKVKKFACDVVLCSSSSRTLTTWRELSNKNGYKFEFKSLDSLYNPTLESCIESLENLSSNVQSALLISHNPTLSILASFLSKEKSVIQFNTCTMKKLSLDIQNWNELYEACGKLEWSLAS